LDRAGESLVLCDQVALRIECHSAPAVDPLGGGVIVPNWASCASASAFSPRAIKRATAVRSADGAGVGCPATAEDLSAVALVVACACRVGAMQIAPMKSRAFKRKEARESCRGPKMS